MIGIERRIVATITASAYGDLDCDGTYSTFEMTTTVDAAGDVDVGKLVTKDELE